MTYNNALKLKNSLSSKYIKKDDYVYEIWITPSIDMEFKTFLNAAQYNNQINDSYAVKFSSNQDFILQKVFFYTPYFLFEKLTQEEIDQLKNQK